MKNNPNTKTEIQHTGSSRQQEIVQEAKLQARATRDHLAEKASETATDAKEAVYEQAENQKQTVVNEINGVNTALRKTAGNLENPPLEDKILDLADQVEKTAERLESAEVEEVVEAVEDFSRTQPLAFMTASFAVGLLAGRFLNATSPSPTHPSSEELETRERGVNREHLVTR